MIKNNILVFMLGMLLISGVSAWDVCIDSSAPEAPANFKLVGNLELTWLASEDLPSCSGVAYYNVYINNELVGEVSDSTSYVGDELPDGSYVFGVSAVDKAENEGEVAVLQVTFPLSLNNNGATTSPSGGGSGGSKTTSSGGGIITGNSSSTTTGENCVENWVCLNWSNQEGECGVRVCTDLNSCGTEETKPLIIKECEDKGFFSFITGGVIGAFGSFGWWVLILFLILIVAFFLVSRKKKKESVPVEKETPVKKKGSKKGKK